VATIKDVAAQANVSTATVSYVLNGTGVVTEATRKRVLEAVAALNYQPNHAARSLRTRSRTIGVVMSALATRLADPVLAEVLAGLGESAAARGYYLLLATVEAADEETSLGEQLVRTGRVDGLVLLDMQADDSRLRALVERGVPLVCAGPVGEAAVSAALVDTRQGVHLALQHLIGLGHRRIALIPLPLDYAQSELIWQGYSEGLAAALIEPDPALTVEVGLSEDDGMAAMQELLSLPEPPSAVLAGSDVLAFGAMHALREAGIEVGRDMSLIGFDDVPMAAHCHPPLTTLHASRRRIGRRLAELLIETIEHKAAPRQELLPMRLMIRKTTAPFRRRGHG
jgi:LacI family transcriptional regulator/LacI family repressor for deo operon, udp, cdd, tsx, nupC, and nupG